jgi:hypothetical protein
VRFGSTDEEIPFDGADLSEPPDLPPSGPARTESSGSPGSDSEGFRAIRSLPTEADSSVGSPEGSLDGSRDDLVALDFDAADESPRFALGPFERSPTGLLPKKGPLVLSRGPFKGRFSPKNCSNSLADDESKHIIRVSRVSHSF